MASPARRRDTAGKIQLLTVQGWGSEHFEGFEEQIECGKPVHAIFRLSNVMQRLLGFWLGSLGQVTRDIAGLKHPTPLLERRREDRFPSCPEPHGSVAGFQLRGG